MPTVKIRWFTGIATVRQFSNYEAGRPAGGTIFMSASGALLSGRRNGLSPEPKGEPDGARVTWF
jgi:hypothetical protein